MAGTITVSLVSMVGDEGGGGGEEGERKKKRGRTKARNGSLAVFFAHREPRTGYCPLREVSAALGG